MAGIFGDLVGSLFGDGGQDAANAALAAAKGIPLPVLKEMNPELYKQIVNLNPELESVINLGPSAMDSVTTDPRLRAAQMAALNKMMDIGNTGGRDAQFLAQANQTQNDVNSNLQGNTGAIQQQMAMRGMSGGMSEMVQKQLAAQGAANRQAQMDLDLNAQAQQRALQAMMNGANLGGQMQSNDFNQASAKAQATDAISRFNAQNQQQVMNNNINARNNAQQWNANQAQGIANQNVDMRNKALDWNTNGMAQQNFNNNMAKIGQVVSGYNGVANSQDRERQANMGLVGNALSAGATAYGANKIGSK